MGGYIDNSAWPKVCSLGTVGAVDYVLLLVSKDKYCSSLRRINPTAPGLRDSGPKERRPDDSDRFDLQTEVDEGV